MKTIRAAGTTRSLLFACACAALATGFGCGGDSTKTTVSGKVTYKGAPVTGGQITVASATGGPNDPVIGITMNADGTYSSKDIPPGEYKVAVSTDSVVAIVAPAGAKDYPMPPPGDTPKKVEIPDKFKNPQTSGITWSVKSGGNSFPIDLDK